MAIDKKLQIFDDEGNPVDYDILASDVKFNDGKDLPTKLDEMEDEIGEGGYTPPAGGIPKTDLAPSVQQTLDDVANKVDKETGKGLSTNDYTTEDKTKLAGLPTNPVQSISVNGTAQSKDTNGNVNIEVSGGSQVTVTTNNDGTFTIHAGDNDYTINLNHMHEDMVKLEKFVESNPPASMTDDTIYVQVNNLTTPTEIEALYIFGLEFTGGVPDTTPKLTSPAATSTIDFGSGTTAEVVVKGRNLLADLSLAITGDFTVTVNGSPVSSISANDANSASGVTLTLTKGNNYDGGTLVISSIDGVSATVNLSFSLPTGFTANKAWDDAGNGSAVLEDAQGYCISPKLSITHGHSFEICFGFTRSSEAGAPKYGCAVHNVDSDIISAGTAATCYSASTSGNTRTVVMEGTCLSCTFLMSQIDNCYIKDTTSNTYIWKGNNVT